MGYEVLALLLSAYAEIAETADLSEMSNTLYEAAHAMRDLSTDFNRLKDMPDCNDCAKKRDCEYLPEWGAPTRVNCPLWVGERDSE